VTGLLLPQATMSMAIRHKRVGRNPAVNFLPDRILDFSLL